MLLTLQEFEYVTKMIYNRTGLWFDLKRHNFVSKRIEKRMELLNIKSFPHYFNLLRIEDQRQELQELINLLTTNESFFFRDYPQLQSFAEHCLPEMVRRKSERNDFDIRIWSAGCSSGEEPYTLAIILHEILENVDDWNIRIIANDIDENILERAKAGRYDNRSVKEVPDEYLSKYFFIDDGQYCVKPNIKKMIQFSHLNLNDQEKMRKMRIFDFIFCRNVLIYFDEDSRKKVVDHFYISLTRGGYVFLGSSESIGRISTAFTLKRMGDYLVYTRE